MLRVKVDKSKLTRKVFTNITNTLDPIQEISSLNQNNIDNNNIKRLNNSKTQKVTLLKVNNNINNENVLTNDSSNKNTKLPNIHNNKKIFSIEERIETEKSETLRDRTTSPEKFKFLRKDDKKIFIDKKLTIKKKEKEPELDLKPFKLRFYVEKSNGFYTLFRTLLKHNNDWIELSENESTVCNYIHIQKTNQTQNILKLPKNNDNLIEFYKQKQKYILD